MTSSVRRSCRSRARAIALVVLAATAAPAAAQSPAGATLQGIVRDGSLGSPITNARVRLEGRRGGALTDAGGRFGFSDVEPGIQVLVVEQYGYESVEVTVDVEAGMPPIEVPLSPLPVMLDGIDVVTDRLTLMETRLESRRRATAQASRAFDQQRLMNTSAFDMSEFLVLEASLIPTACGGRSPFGSACVLRRGRSVQPRVYIDEALVIGGIEQLGSYQPYDLYLVEVYSQGLEIRAYTHGFMERMARRPVALIPIGLR